MSQSDGTETLKLISGDGQSFTVSKAEIQQSSMLRDLVEVAGNQDITLDFIHSNDLKKIVEFMKFHASQNTDTKKGTDADVRAFNERITAECTADNKSHMRFLVNTDKLGLPTFFDLLAQSFSDKITNKSSEDLRREWYVTQFTPLTEEQRHIIYETSDWLYPTTDTEDGK
jgi:hypothetical protein